MRVQSHLDDMRTAIRGDFERLAERRGSQDLMHVAQSAEDQPAVSEVEEEPDHDRRSWLARLRSR